MTRGAPRYCSCGQRAVRSTWFCSDLCRFMAKVIKTPSGCWWWTATKDYHGYGTFYLGRNTGAHRAAYILMVGPIPEGLHIDHLCRHVWCVNPLHLEAVTQRINTLRGNAPRSIRHRVGKCGRGHSLADAPVGKSGWKRCNACRRARRAELKAAA